MQPKSWELSSEAVVYLNEQHCTDVMKGLLQQRTEGYCCDVTLKTPGADVRAHSCVLAANSKWFRDRVMRKVAGQNNFLIHIDCKTSATVESFIEYFYSGRISISMTTVHDILKLSNLYSVDDIKQCCALHLENNLTSSSLWYILQLSQEFSLSHVNGLCVKTFMNDFEDLVQDDRFNHVAFDFLEKFLCTVIDGQRKSELNKLLGILKWVLASFEDRATHLAGLLSKVAKEEIFKEDLEDILGPLLRNERDHAIRFHADFLNFIANISSKPEITVPVPDLLDFPPKDESILSHDNLLEGDTTSGIFQTPVNEIAPPPLVPITDEELGTKHSMLETLESGEAAPDECTSSINHFVQTLDLKPLTTSPPEVPEPSKERRSKRTPKRKNLDIDPEVTPKPNPKRKTRATRLMKEAESSPTKTSETKPSKKQLCNKGEADLDDVVRDEFGALDLTTDNFVMPPVVQTRRPRGKKATTEEEMYSCEKCERKFSTPSRLRHHMKGHGSDTPYLCATCGFSTRHYASMNIHMKLHTGKTFKCEIPGCTFATIRRSRFEDHLDAHNGVKNHVCSICGKAFAGRKHMQRHEKIHNIKELACPGSDCGYRTGRKDKLKDHTMLHHPDIALRLGYGNPLPCGEEGCTFQCITENQRKEHLKREHPYTAFQRGLLKKDEYAVKRELAGEDIKVKPNPANPRRGTRMPRVQLNLDQLKSGGGVSLALAGPALDTGDKPISAADMVKLLTSLATSQRAERTGGATGGMTSSDKIPKIKLVYHPGASTVISAQPATPPASKTQTHPAPQSRAGALQHVTPQSHAGALQHVTLQSDVTYQSSSNSSITSQITKTEGGVTSSTYVLNIAPNSQC